MMSASFTRRQALAAALALPTLAAGIHASRPPLPAWAVSWDEVAAVLANMEEAANRGELPRRRAYAGAIQFSREAFLVFGVRTPDEFDRWRTSTAFEVLGSARSERGTAWGVLGLGSIVRGRTPTVYVADLFEGAAS